MKIIALFLSLGLIFTSSSAIAMSLNDLTILLPLPQESEMSLVLKPEDKGAQGALLSKKTYQEIVQLVPEVPNHIIWKQALQVVGVRIDPCFTEGEGPLPCRRQIRLVWQPVFHEEGVVDTRDAAIHSFYEFDDESFKKVWQAWQKLSSGSSQDALQIHPRLKKEGLHGAYWIYLRSLILNFCGENNLIRMTAMNVMAGEQLWIFSGFDVINGQAKHMAIPRIRGQTQGVIQSSSQFQSFSGGMMPAPEEHDPEFSKLTADSWTAKKKFTEAQIREVLGRALEYENPERHNPGTIDCASCHLANMVHQWGEVNFAQFNWNSDFKESKFQSAWNLTNPTKTTIKTNQLRAFGYFTNVPAISQRVINETAQTAIYFKLQK
ncbi:hypothetical protein ACLWBD_11560 [Bdellovibrio sp. HCB117]|uniref:hypothetical protein n=1 Tax=Bdellovibrio sp. HCB117 TaxID=3394359 RepID=UPI0039B43859